VSSQPADGYNFSYGDGKANYHLETGFFIHKGIIAVVERVAFISDRMSYVTLSSRYCNVILNVHAPREKGML
jgi:hypothetical protein